MKKLLPLLILPICFSAFADWVRVGETNTLNFEKFIDPENVKQSGPMAIMRQVWEISNYLQKGSDETVSEKVLAEYDCQNHRVRLLKHLKFTGLWSTGSELLPGNLNQTESNWTSIEPKSIEEEIINMVCPDGRDD